MGKITSKYQITIPRHLAESLGVRPGDEVQWQEAPGGLRVTPAGRSETLTIENRLRMFDLATARQQRRGRKAIPCRRTPDRGWKREDLYDRGRTR